LRRGCDHVVNVLLILQRITCVHSALLEVLGFTSMLVTVVGESALMVQMVQPIYMTCSVTETRNLDDEGNLWESHRCILSGTSVRFLSLWCLRPEFARCDGLCITITADTQSPSPVSSPHVFSLLPLIVLHDSSLLNIPLDLPTRHALQIRIACGPGTRRSQPTSQQWRACRRSGPPAASPCQLELSLL
jgi:hypothetical protein